MSTVSPLDARVARVHFEHADAYRDRAMTVQRADYTQKPAAHGCPAGTDHDRAAVDCGFLRVIGTVIGHRSVPTGVCVFDVGAGQTGVEGRYRWHARLRHFRSVD